MTTLGAPAVAGFSRFHAIVTAKPMNPAAPQPQQPVQVSETLYRQEPTNTYEQWGVRFQTERRKKSTNEGGSTAPKKASKRASDEDGGSGREVSLPNGSLQITLAQMTFTAHNLIQRQRGAFVCITGSL